MMAKMITIDVWEAPPGRAIVKSWGTAAAVAQQEAFRMDDLSALDSLELAYLHRLVERTFWTRFGKSPEDFMDGMRRLLAPADPSSLQADREASAMG